MERLIRILDQYRLFEVVTVLGRLSWACDVRDRFEVRSQRPLRLYWDTCICLPEMVGGHINVVLQSTRS